MKKYFDKELLFLRAISNLNIKDINIGGLIISALILFISLNNIQLLPYIGSYISFTTALILLIIVSTFIRKTSTIEMRKFLTLQIILLFLLFLIVYIFPLQLTWVKVYLSIYLTYNYFIYTFTSIYNFSLK